MEWIELDTVKSKTFDTFNTFVGKLPRDKIRTIRVISDIAPFRATYDTHASNETAVADITEINECTYDISTEQIQLFTKTLSIVAEAPIRVYLELTHTYDDTVYLMTPIHEPRSLSKMEHFSLGDSTRFTLVSDKNLGDASVKLQCKGHDMMHTIPVKALFTKEQLDSCRLDFDFTERILYFLWRHPEESSVSDLNCTLWVSNIQASVSILYVVKQDYALKNF